MEIEFFAFLITEAIALILKSFGIPMPWFVKMIVKNVISSIIKKNM